MHRKVAIVSEDWDVIEMIQKETSFDIVGCFSKGLFHPNCIVDLGEDSCWPEFKAENDNVKIILAVDSPLAREELYYYYGDSNIISVRASNSLISIHATIGNGSIVQMKSMVMAHVKMGFCCKVNINVVIHHDVQIGNFCTIAPGALLLGNVKLGNRVYVGAGAIIKQRCVIGDDCIIGAGAVVVEDIPAGLVVAGVPAKKLLHPKLASIPLDKSKV